MKWRYGAATSRKPRSKTATRVSRQTQMGLALKQVPTLVAVTIESRRQGALQPVHAFDEIRPRGFNGQMKAATRRAAPIPE